MEALARKLTECLRRLVPQNKVLSTDLCRELASGVVLADLLRVLKGPAVKRLARRKTAG